MRTATPPLVAPTVGRQAWVPFVGAANGGLQVRPRRARLRGAWGWHPLDSRWAQRDVDAAGVKPGDLVLDVGAGLGALTAPLVRADAGDLRLPSRPFRVVSSPPYGISTALLKRLLAPGTRLVAADLVMQPHVDSAVLTIRRRT